VDLRTIVFDVNETLLDLAELRESFVTALGDGETMREWFARMLHLSLVTTITGLDRDFGEVGRAALRAVAERHGRMLDDPVIAMLVGRLRELPPHPEVPEALVRLKEAGFRTAALTNSPDEVARAQLAYAGLEELLDPVLSVDVVGRFKPAPETYAMAEEALGAQPSELRLVAAHDWDVIGALRAGWVAAFVARPGQTWAPIVDRPDIVGGDLIEVADRIIDVDR
jgi:2-haloacid dehalogenase